MSAGMTARVGRYDIFDELAAGGMATVHLGRMHGAAGFARIVAIKRLRSMRGDTDFVSSLLHEARLSERIRHANVVATLDVVSSDQELLLVMEYVHGETLASLLRACAANGEGVPPEIAASITRDALLGLHAAHEATDALGQRLTIIHRDVSPQNVMVGSDGAARLLDFGIAKAMGSASTTREGQVKGKVPYMAPEILRFEPATPQSDIWSVGVMLWETLCTRRLFRGDSEVDVWGKVLQQHVQRPSEVIGKPVPLDAIVMRALERDTSRRYPDALAMAKDIESAVALASPTDVSAWVNRRAGAALARRAALVRSIEALPIDPLRDSAPLATPPPPNTGRGEVPAISTSITSATPPPAMARRSPAAAIAIGLLVLAGLGGAGAWRLRARAARTAVVSAPPSASEPAPAASSVASIPSVAPPPPVSATPPKVEAPEPSASVAKPLASKGAPKGTRTPAAAKVVKKAAACDPPYSIDADGKKHFKLECVEQQQ